MSNLNFAWARALVESLGVEHAVVAPGSRSAPLAIACAELVKTHVVVDERSAAFVALGIGKATGKPALVLATSGTAGAHFFPAILEAEAAGVPLVALTADRPPELHGFGAPQSIDQHRLFGAHVAFFADVGLPSADFRHLRALAARAAFAARRAPVHLNAPFREPLAPVDEPMPAIADGPAARFGEAAGVPDPGAVLALIRRHERGVIVCGPRDADDGLAAAVERLARATGYAVIAEATSQLRFAVPSAVAHADAILRDERWARALQPDFVLRLGGGLCSKVVQEFVERAGAQVIVHERGEVIDPLHRATHLLRGDAAAIVDALCAAQLSSAYGAQFVEADRRARGALEDLPFGEPLAARETLASVPAGGVLFVSNSMPVRDLDVFGAVARTGVRVLANRGVNGIDGVVSSALGTALGSGRPTTVLLGDLALQHDLSGLLAAARLRAQLQVVVVHNDGGGIFHFLPIADHPDRFEQLFGTPHALDFAHAAALAGFPHRRATTAAELRDALRSARLVEVRTDRAANVAQHRALQAKVAAALGDPR